ASKEIRILVQEDLMNDTAKREIASILRCDGSLIISEFEMQLLQETYKIDSNLLFYLPILFEPIDARVQQNWPTYETRKHFVFIGNFLHEPNVNAVQYLKKDIWPLIRKAVPTAALHIYGAYPSQKIFSLHKPQQGFYVLGRTESSKEILENARVCLAPLRFGAGLKGKLLESMICGTPSVTTTIGAEGIPGAIDWPGMIADDPKEFANAAVQLYEDNNLWKAKQQSGVQIIHSRFSKNIFENEFIKYFNRLKNNLTAHRLQNFTGAMLMQQTTLASKYMSKWIESKNKIKHIGGT
ncbi:MAG: glycosyltransferase family 4 protein, partial [Bacteroidota bacterium]|nr:glycosyltransferase family 4 protein [Bacteroidota bacterium]